MTCYLDEISDLGHAVLQLSSYDQPLNYDSDCFTLQGSDSVLVRVKIVRLSAACALPKMFGVCF